ncbi:MAG TPA: AAA family ATPase [Acidimicrobiales bacterium]|nr:AAA family ATPase [Acidimicrobiales bacterium]
MAATRGAAPAPHPDRFCFLLTDIVESTRLWEQDPLAMDAAVARHDEIIRASVERAGGRLVRHRGEGDSTFSLFDDPLDAVVAAADVVRRLGAEPWPGGTPIVIRSGLHVGDVIERDGEWYGPTVNRTARLRGLAAPGEVLVSTAVSEAVTGRLPSGLALVDRGSHALRGAARHEWTRALVDERERFAHDPAGVALRALPLPPGLLPRPDEVPLQGRSDVLVRLRSRWTEARAGRQRTVLLAGDAGMGKSRLAREVAQEAHAGGGTVLHVECDGPDGHTLLPIARAVTALVGGLAPGEAQRLAGEAAPTLARLAPEVAARLGVTRPPDAADASAALDAVTEVLASLSSTAPVLIVIDDVHLAGEAVAGLVRGIRGAERRSMMIVATCRPADVRSGTPIAALVEEVSAAPGAERIRLSGLAHEATRDLARFFVGERDTADRAAGVLQSATGGNPFLLTAVLRDLQASGGLAGVRDPEDLVLPETVAEVAVERMGRMPPGDADVLRVAAVLGREIDLDLVAAVAGASARELAEAEEAWEAGAFVVRDGAGRLSIGHALLCQAIADQVSEVRRHRLHRRAAEALDGWGRSAEAARHWRAAADAGDGRRLAVAAYAAATDALARTDLDASRDWVEVALGALDEDGQDELDLRGRLHLVAADASLHVSVERALAAADQAIACARAAGDAGTFARAALTRCNGYTVVLNGEDPLGMALHEEALGTLREDEPALRSRLLANVANHRARRDGLGVMATPIAEEAVALARRAGDDAALAYAIRMWLQVRQGAPDAEERTHLADEMVAAAERVGDRWELMLSLQRRAGVRLELGDRPAYEHDIAEAERRAARIPTTVARYEVLFRRVLRSALDGRFVDARRHLGAIAELVATLPTAMDAWATQTLLLEREVGDLAAMVEVITDAARANPGLVAYRVALAVASVRAGQTEEAAAIVADLCRDDLRAIPRDSAWPSLLALLAEVAIELEDTATVEILRRELGPHAGLLLLGYESICLGAADRFIAMLDAHLGVPADEGFEGAARLEQRAGAPALMARTRVWQARARLANDDPVGAVLALDAALELTRDLGMPFLEAEARRLWEQAQDRALVAIGTRPVASGGWLPPSTS